ncbi:MAG: tetratricopeptide repeat protein, partial [Pseudomonadota bacterium]
MLNRNSLPSLIALTAALTVGATVAAQQIKTSGEGALVIAARMIEEDKLDEAEAVLRTLSTGDPDKLDMRLVDALAAKIAYKRGHPEEALRILEAMVAHAPADWKRRYDLVQLLIAEKKDRRARYHIRALLKQDVPDIVRTKARSDL